jgi:hypothetical protein
MTRVRKRNAIGEQPGENAAEAEAGSGEPPGGPGPQI